MSEPNRTIFRAEALQRHARAREQVVFPRLIAPPVFACLWLLVGLLIVALVAAWSASVPVYATGAAIVLDASARSRLAGDGEVVAFFPPDHLPQLQPGQSLALRAGATGAATAIIVAVEPTVISPAAAHRRFELAGAGTAVIAQPAAVAIARLDRAGSPLVDLDSLAGSVYTVETPIGARRVLALLAPTGE